ncbi:MAG: hypothetical protein QMC90_01775 [Dehalococcoidales bacterium]|nr:hypothetical protein [Dehalococcoidales bacterium]
MPIIKWYPTTRRAAQRGHSDLKSVLDTTLRVEQDRRLLGDTRILMRDQASCQGSPFEIKTSFNPSWKLGKLYLSPSRLLFIQGRNILFFIPISKIVETSIVEREWLAGRIINQLCLVIRGYNPFYIAVRNPQSWKGAIDNLIGD